MYDQCCEAKAVQAACSEQLRDVLSGLLGKAERISGKVKAVRDNVIGAVPDKPSNKREINCMAAVIYAAHDVLNDAEDALDSLLNAL